MSNRVWFRMFWFYLRTALFGDRAARRPERRAAVERPHAAKVTDLKPAAYTR